MVRARWNCGMDSYSKSDDYRIDIVDGGVPVLSAQLVSAYRRDRVPHGRFLILCIFFGFKLPDSC